MRPRHAILATVLPAALLASLPAQEPPAPAAIREPVVVLLDGRSAPQRRATLLAARAAVRERRPAPELADALRAEAAAASAGLARAIAAAGGTVEAVLVAPLAVHATLPVAVLPALAAQAGVVRIDPVRSFRAHTGDATSAADHHATFVHTVQGLRGEGQVLALVDTGVELDYLGTGLPHPAFRDAGGASRVVHSWSVQGPALGDRSDLNGHGTGVGSVAAGRRWSTSALVADGFAPAAGLASYRVTRGSGDIATDVDLALAYGQILLDVIGGLPVRVANCSFGGNPDPRAVEQQALDELAFWGDVVVVTSAGNVAVPPNLDQRATEQSQAATNGIATGAVAKSTHVVAPFSAWGPLHGDGHRTFPDLAAVGQAVRVAVRTSAGHQTVDGTSYSAPMVAGTALLVRQARPDLDATAVKAMLLGTATDLEAANPGRTRNHFGIGLLRSDLAVQQALAVLAANATGDPGAGRLCRGSVGVGAAANWSLALPAGAARATLVWQRDDPAAADRADLDLEVTDAAGRLVARGNAERNLYEHVVFRAAAGTFTFTVRGRVVPGDDAGYALLVGDAGGAPATPATAGRSGGCAGTGVAAGAQLVLPAGAGFLGGRTNKPLADAPLVLQAAYDRTQIGAPRSVQALGFRRAAAEGPTAPFDVRLRITLGYTNRAPNDLLATLAANFAAAPPPVVAFDGWLRLPPTLAGPAADQFDFVAPLTAPFLLDGASGNPLVQLEVLGNSLGNQPQPLGLDAALVTTGASLGALVQFAGVPFALAVPQRPALGFFADAPRAGLPRLQWSGAPRLGAALDFALSAARENTLAALLFGFAPSWLGASLPLDLAAIGAPGCALAAAPESVVFAATGAGGQAEVAFPVPADPALLGALANAQFVVFDAGANAPGLAFSPGVELLFGG